MPKAARARSSSSQRVKAVSNCAGRANHGGQRARGLGVAAAAIAVVAAMLAPVATAAQAPIGQCPASSASSASARPAPPLHFGIAPAGEAGALGPQVPLTPIDMGKTLSALGRLRPPHAPFVLRLNRFFWSDGERGIRRFARLARRYTRRGYQVELQLRYHPTAAQEGDIPAWVRFVREVVRRFGPNRGVTGLQVTNEVNLYPIAPDASDSAFARSRDALIRGVEAAHRTVHGDRAFGSSRSASTGSIGPIRRTRRASGATCATREAAALPARSTGWGSTPIPAPCSRLSPRRSAAAFAMPCSRRWASFGTATCRSRDLGWAADPRGGERLADRPGRTEREQVAGPAPDGSRGQRPPRRRPRHRLPLVRPSRPQHRRPRTSSSTTGCSATTTRRKRAFGSTGG